MAEKPQGSARPSQPVPRVSNGGTGGQKPVVRSDVDRAMLLRDVMDHAVKVHNETSRPMLRQQGFRTIALTLVCVPLLAFCVYSWVARPEFLWGPRQLPLPAVQQEANIRFAMFLLGQRIEAYRHSQGSYPASLEALGESIPGVSYALADSVFELRTVENGKPIVFRPDRSADAFLGNTTDIIQGIAPK